MKYRLSFPGRFVAAAASVWLSAAAGCNSDSTVVTSGTSTISQSGDAVQRREVGAQLFASAIDMLGRTDEYDEGSTDAAVAQLVRRLNESLDVLQPGTSAAALTDDDGKVLREVVWLRDCARHAVGDETDALRRGERLFDWVIRNVQQVPEAIAVEALPPMLPWHVLLFGRGTPLDQAWLFQLLARQQRLDVVLLAYPDSKSDASPRWWCAALLHEGRLYLFDFRLGLPIAGPEGKGVATLDQAAADDKLLRVYDRADKPYPVKAADVAKMAALCEASGAYLSPQMARLESQLSGAQRMQLSVDPQKLRERVAKCAGIVEARAWPIRELRFKAGREKQPYEQLSWFLLPFRLPDRSMPIAGKIMSPPLWKARVRHISGKFVDPFTKRSTINYLYQNARPPDKDLELAARHEEIFDGLMRMKQNATFWLGLTAYELGNYAAAVNYFKIILNDKLNGGWTAPARYNLGRTYEVQANPTKALETYGATYFDIPPDELCRQRIRHLQ